MSPRKGAWVGLASVLIAACSGSEAPSGTPAPAVGQGGTTAGVSGGGSAGASGNPSGGSGTAGQNTAGEP
ncbi:MAG TPA: hypothetical protein VM686_36115, partial [Polyangiaceae bacterium]|nr:hypothetical protein [Polyangiaceae bacterium]